MLIKLGWAEKVVQSLTEIFPNADLYTLIYDEKLVGKIFPRDQVHPSCTSLPSQRIYKLLKKQRLCLPFMKSSVEKLDFSSYDRVIVSSSWFAHGLKTGPKTKTIIYYHAPARYMWDWTHEYRKEIGMNRGIKWYFYGNFMKKLRLWDYNAAKNNDILLANSATTQSRIKKYFRRESKIVFPPIETQRFAKKINSLLNPLPFQGTFKNMPHANLLIIWAGEHKTELEKISGGKENIKFAGAQYWDDLVSLVQNSLGLIFPGEEDFGIVPIEVMAAGKPVFALNRWGLTETVIAGKTGDFFENPDGSDFIKKFQIFHTYNLAWKYEAQDCKEQAWKYDLNVFEKTIKQIIT